MVIGIVMAAMAASNSTTTPRSTAASSSTYSAARDYLLYLVRAPDYVGLLHNINNNITAADQYNVWLLQRAKETARRSATGCGNVPGARARGRILQRRGESPAESREPPSTGGALTRQKMKLEPQHAPDARKWARAPHAARLDNTPQSTQTRRPSGAATATGAPPPSRQHECSGVTTPGGKVRARKDGRPNQNPKKNSEPREKKNKLSQEKKEDPPYKKKRDTPSKKKRPKKIETPPPKKKRPPSKKQKTPKRDSTLQNAL